MWGVIGFEGFRVQCIIGMEPHERLTEQQLIIDMKVEADISAATATDNLSDTVDYVQLAALCSEMARRGRYFLLEKYAADLTAAVIGIYGVRSVWVRIKKPSALKDAGCALVELMRKR